MANPVAFGFMGLQHLMDQKVDEIDVDVIRGAITETLQFHTRSVNALMNGVVHRTTKIKTNYRLPAAAGLQPLDEWGRPVPRKIGASYNVAYPLQRGGDAYGTNRESRALMTLDDLNEIMNTVTMGDLIWIRSHIMGAWLTKTAWTYGDPRFGDLTIQTLANGDGVLYNRRNGTTSTDNHYLGQAGAIADGATTNPFPIIYAELNEHPQNTGPFIAYVASNLVATTQLLSSFDESPDPDIQYGANARLLATPQFDPDNTPYGVNNGFGERLLGKADNMWIREWAALPDNYIVAHAVGAGSFIAMREQPATALQGFFPEYADIDGNVQQTSFIRIAGFAPDNRVAALAYYVGNATYPNPTGLTAPLEA